MIKQLKKLGLSSTEAKVYIAMLELGEATTTRISQKAQLKRSTAYSAIDALRESGLITRSKRNKRFVYYIENPSEVVRVAEEKVEIAEKILPSLLSIANLVDKKPQLAYYEGVDGIKNMYKKSLTSPGTPMFGWVPVSTLHGEIRTWYDEYYRPKRIALKKFWYNIAPDSDDARAYQAGDTVGFKKTLIDSSGDLIGEGSVLLYGTQSVAIFSWEDMVAVTIESKTLHSTLLSLFKIHWKSLDGPKFE